MLAQNVAAVHTTGVNWQSVLTIIVSTVSTLSILGAVVARYISNKITGAINAFQINVVSVLNDRLTKVEILLQSVDANNPARRGRRD